MKSLLNPESKPMEFMTALGDLIILNLLWVLTSLPVITIGASTTALYSVLIEFDARVVHDGSTVRRFLKAFRANFRQATLIFLILAIPLAILAMDTLAAMVGIFKFSSMWRFLLIFPVVAWLITWSYSFPLIAVFENTIAQTMKNLPLIAVSHPLATIILCVLNSLPAAMALFMPSLAVRTIPLWLFFGFSLIAKGNASLLSRIFSYYAPTHPQQEDNSDC